MSCVRVRIFLVPNRCINIEGQQLVSFALSDQLLSLTNFEYNHKKNILFFTGTAWCSHTCLHHVPGFWRSGKAHSWANGG